MSAELQDPHGALWRGLTQHGGRVHLRVVGVPFEGGAGGAGGASLGPGRVRELSRRAKTISWRGVDYSQLRMRDCGDVTTWRFDLSRTVAQVRASYDAIFADLSSPVLTIGGDHSVAFPIVAAAAAALGPGKRLGLIWFDAHPDVLDDYQGSSISHGSPLRRIVDAGAVRPTDVLLVGTRAYDPGEPEYLRDHGLVELPAAVFAIDPAAGREEFATRAAELADRVDYLYVSIDIDVLDAAQVPGTGTPVAGGISSLTLLGLLELLPGPVLGYDIVEFAPSHDVGNCTGLTVMALISLVQARVAEAEGITARGYSVSRSTSSATPANAVVRTSWPADSGVAG